MKNSEKQNRKIKDIGQEKQKTKQKQHKTKKKKERIKRESEKKKVILPAQPIFLNDFSHVV